MRGLTLVDTCIAIAAVGLMALITAPQLTRASESSVIEELDQQLSLASEAIRSYREVHPGSPVVATTDDGWGHVLEAGLIRTKPMNAYAGSPVLVSGTALYARSIGPHTGYGYVYQEESGVLFAVGFDQANRKLFHQPGFAAEPEVGEIHNLGFRSSSR